jgi:site-specific recombinase XerD
MVKIRGIPTMKILNAENERIKRNYLGHLKHARGFSESTLDQADQAIHRFECYTRSKSFRLFHIEQAKGFKQHLADERNARTKKPLSHATIYSTLNALRAFFVWLADQPGFKSRISLRMPTKREGSSLPVWCNPEA